MRENKVIRRCSACAIMALTVCSVVAADKWPTSAQWAYIDRCSGSFRSQGLSAEMARSYCTCITEGMEAEFGIQEYDEMMQADPSPEGDEYDRRLYEVLVSCQEYLPR